MADIGIHLKNIIAVTRLDASRDIGVNLKYIREVTANECLDVSEMSNVRNARCDADITGVCPGNRPDIIGIAACNLVRCSAVRPTGGLSLYSIKYAYESPL